MVRHPPVKLIKALGKLLGTFTVALKMIYVTRPITVSFTHYAMMNVIFINSLSLVMEEQKLSFCSISGKCVNYKPVINIGQFQGYHIWYTIHIVVIAVDKGAKCYYQCCIIGIQYKGNICSQYERNSLRVQYPEVQYWSLWNTSTDSQKKRLLDVNY